MTANLFLLLAILFWGSIGLILFANVGYPLVIWLASRHRPDAASTVEAASRSLDMTEWPFLSIVIAAYKEETWILSRLENAIGLDYPADRFEVLVGCDGKEDLTAELAEAFGDDRVRTIVFPERRGKASVLNDLVPLAQGELLVFSDANTLFERSALRRLVRHFVMARATGAEAPVGGVVGRLVLVDPLTGTNVDSLYWKYENFLKACEGRLGALLGANGGIYAVRKHLVAPLDPRTILDDFVIGMRVHQQGHRLLYDATALAYEETPATVKDEFRRRARIGAGGFQSLPALAGLLWPHRGWLAFAFWSHKVLRWFGPLLMLVAVVTNGVLAIYDPLYRALAVGQAALYALALVTPVLSLARGWQKALRLPEMFLQMNLALAVGFFRWLRGIRTGAWGVTPRLAVSPVTNLPARESVPEVVSN
jgi:cellulose synthase/poly-beta-1,6-N-acetylglucosamine synthase-like glycosyltransferase